MDSKLEKEAGNGNGHGKGHPGGNGQRNRKPDLSDLTSKELAYHFDRESDAEERNRIRAFLETQSPDYRQTYRIHLGAFLLSDY